MELNAKKEILDITSLFYSDDVDKDIRVSFYTKTFDGAKYNIPAFLTQEHIWRFLVTLTNLYAKFVAIDAGRVLGSDATAFQFDLADAFRDFWQDDWFRDEAEPYSSNYHDSTTLLQTIAETLQEYVLPPAIQADMVKLFSPRKISAAPYSPFVAFCPSRAPVLSSLVVDGTPREEYETALPTLGHIRKPFRLLGRDISAGAKAHVPPTARSLAKELDTFRQQPINKSILRLFHNVFGAAWDIKLPSSYSSAMDADFMALWDNGGVAHTLSGHSNPVVIPNAGNLEATSRHEIPLWASTKLTDFFVKYWTHGFGPARNKVAGHFLLNHNGAGNDTLVTTGGILPLYMYAHDDPTRPPLRNYLAQRVDITEDSVLRAPMYDEMRLGIRMIYQVGDAILKSRAEIGYMPVNPVHGQMQWANVSLLRQKAWLAWRETLGVTG